MAKGDFLGEFEQIIMLAVLRQYLRSMLSSIWATYLSSALLSTAVSRTPARLSCSEDGSQAEPRWDLRCARPCQLRRRSKSSAN